MKQNKSLSTRNGKKVVPINILGRDSLRNKAIKTCMSERIPEFIYHIYTPSCGAEGLPVLVAVHGVSHCAKEQARAFSAYAERYGFVVIAPLFCRKNFPAYQRLGVSEQKVPSYPDLALNTLLDEVSENTGAVTDRVYLFGHSAGGQFAHRYAMAYPDRVHAAALGAPGWYTFPNTQAPFPRGLRERSKFRSVTLDPECFLKVPMATFVGENDIESDLTFKRSKNLDLQQGLSRIERAERWTIAMREASEQYGLETQYKSHVLKSCGHSFSDCLEHGNLGFQVLNFLFEATRCQRPVRQAMAKLPNLSENYRIA